MVSDRRLGDPDAGGSPGGAEGGPGPARKRDTDSRRAAHPHADAAAAGREAGTLGVEATGWSRLHEELSVSGNHLRAILDTAPDGILALDASGSIVCANRAAAELLGCDRVALRGRPLAAALEACVAGGQPLSESLGAVPEDGVAFRIEGEVRRADGAVPVEVEASRLTMDSGRITTIILRDISERRRAEDELRRRDQELGDFMETAPIGLSCIGPDNRIAWANQAELVMLGYARDDLLGRPLPDLFSDPAAAQDCLGRLAARHDLQAYEARLRRKDGSSLDVALSTSAFYRGGELVQTRCFMIDVTARNIAEERLRHEASHDGLTGLPNRAYFQRLVGQALARQKRDPDRGFAVLYLDLDHLKVVNDSLGHPAGDRLIRRAGSRVRRVTRGFDTVARLGGDEFAVLVEDVGGVADAVAVAERYGAELRRPFQLMGQEVGCTASIGIALACEGYRTPDEILRDADIALYRAKALGRARHEVFERGMRSKAVERLNLYSELRRAVKSESYCVQFQPIVTLRARRIIGFEAMVRLQRPDGSLLHPTEFLHAAEETGLIVPIGLWVIREACRHLRAWHRSYPADPPRFVSVNVSSSLLSQPGFEASIASILRETGLDPGSLALEITERMLLDPEWARRLMVLEALGVRLDLDDFGTGYSSLERLHRLPLHALKIDRSFTMALGVERRGTALVQSVIDLGANLGTSVIAEGVENAAQEHELRQLGCGYAQGFHFGHPLCPEAAASLLAGGGPVH